MTATMIRAAGALAILAISALPACAQNLERRVSGAPSGNVTFHFASRPTVCGDGKSYFRSDSDNWYGSFNYYNDGMSRASPCEAGPIRVTLYRDGRDLVRIQTYAGPLATEPNTTDLGAVRVQDAVDYLMGIASTVDGRPARDALLPAMLADSVSSTRELLALAKDPLRSRDVRRNALSWLVRRRGEPGGMTAAEVSRTLTTIARDETENRDVRGQAVSSLARLETGDGLSAVVAMSQETGDSWLAARSVQELANSGDPRSRTPLRAAAERTDLSEEARVQAIQGIAGQYSTSKDGEFLRGLYRRVSSERLHDAVMSGVAQIGGSESRDWMLAIAKNADEPVQARKRAISLADRIGMTAADLTRLYDTITDNEVQATIISELAQNGTRVASDKLIAIAKSDPSASNRRRAIQALGRFDDQRVKDLLKELVAR